MSKRLLAALALVALPATAQPPGHPSMEKPAAAMETAKERPAPEERRSVTHHSATIGGERIEYTATAGTVVLESEEGEPQASIFYVAYTRDGVSDPAKRPLTFSFNGGPGSASVWLHLGILGPRRVAMDEEGKALPPPYRLEENPFSLLDVTDLVFIDPVSTGFSRPAPGVDAGEFHGVEEDVESVGWFVRRWLSENGRWASPKFLIGESYGTTRAAGLVGYLQDRHGVYFNGVMLVSSILSFQTADFDLGNDLPSSSTCRPTRRPPGTTAGSRRASTSSRRSRKRRTSPWATTPWLCSRATSCRPRSGTWWRRSWRG